MSIFTKKDFNSGNGFQSAIFGPIIWSSLHMISFNYPVEPTVEDKKNYKEWLFSWQYVLPCIYCRQNFLKNIEKTGYNDKVMNNRETFSRFIYNLHNCINDMLGKDIKISYNEVRSRYENFRSRCSEKERTKEIKAIEAKSEKEKGCDGSLYGVKSKSIIKIVPNGSKAASFHVSDKCKVKKLSKKK